MKKDSVTSQLKNFKQIKPRSEWQAQTRALLLSEIKSNTVQKTSWREYTGVFIGLFRQRMLEPALVMLLVLGFSVGSSLVVNASFYSLPGESLYSVKIALENAQTAITPNEQRRTELQFDFAQKRLGELDKIVSQINIEPDVKREQLNTAARALQKNIESVRQSVTKLNQSRSNTADREATLSIAINISDDAKELAKQLDEANKKLSASEEDSVRMLLAEATESAQAVSLSAEQLAKPETETNQGSTETATTTESVIEPEDGEVLGEQTQDSESATSTSTPTDSNDTTESETATSTQTTTN